MTTRKPTDRAINLALASVAGLSGCVTLILVVSALLLGLWLDQQLDTKPIFTIGCIIGSVPITLVVMFRMVLRSATAIQQRQYGNTSDQTKHQNANTDEEALL
jgi:F0F1-type ATP synthase assembly protein I